MYPEMLKLNKNPYKAEGIQGQPKVQHFQYLKHKMADQLKIFSNDVEKLISRRTIFKIRNIVLV